MFRFLIGCRLFRGARIGDQDSCGGSVHGATKARLGAHGPRHAIAKPRSNQKHDARGLVYICPFTLLPFECDIRPDRASTSQSPSRPCTTQAGPALGLARTQAPLCQISDIALPYPFISLQINSRCKAATFCAVLPAHSASNSLSKWPR